jgi:hypothetical protein
MKKLLVCLVAASMIVAFAAPVMAETSVDVSGYYEVEGYWNDNPDYADYDSTMSFFGPVTGAPYSQSNSSDAWLEHKMRLKAVFHANDNVSVTTRMDILDDEKWGDGDVPYATTSDDEDIDFDQVYMTIKSNIGLFQVGRQDGGAWGLKFGDDKEDYDRIKYVLPVGDLILVAIYQKCDEEDAQNMSDDNDLDVYYLAGIYKQETWEAGLLSAYARGADNVNCLASALSLVTGTSGPGVMNKYGLLPYAKAMFGPFGVQGEIVYEFGEYEFDAAGSQDVDISGLSYNLEGSFNMDMGKVFAGWASRSGQDFDKTDEITIGNLTYGGLGDDFHPLAMLTDDLGGNALNSNTFFLSGVDMLYTGAEISISDALSINFAAGMAWANEDDWADAVNIDDEYGWEVDAGLVWKIMDNLTYSATLCYVNAGELLATGGDVPMADAATLAALGGSAYDPEEDAAMGFINKIKVDF